MYNVGRNNFYKNEKLATIYTPIEVSNFIFNLINKKIDKNKIIFDPCVGTGNLLKPFNEKGFKTLGIDIINQGFPNTIERNILEIKRNEMFNPDDIGLVIMNPPFNIDETTKKYIKENYQGRPLLPEIWLQKVLELVNHDTPIIMFTPYGFRLNQTIESKRWVKFSFGTYPEISSIISLPKNIFLNVLFHSEILIFNVKNLKGHYFLYQKNI